MSDVPIERWDIFVAHASEDKQALVQPLASALAAFGVNVWYDEYALRVGDSLSRSIDLGLANSDYGLVVLSPAFLAKKWPEYELRGLNAREMQGGKVILPVWHNVTFDDILKFSPPLADKIAIQTSSLTPLQTAVEVIKTIRPDIFTRIMRRIAHHELVRRAEVELVETTKLRPSPIQHEVLSPELVGRIRLVRASLLGAYTHSMDFWMDGFKRDAHPTKEVEYWERVAAVYREYAAMTPLLTTERHTQVVQLISALSRGDNEAALEKLSVELPEQAIEVVSNLLGFAEPVYDIEEELPFAGKGSASDGDVPLAFDKEHFPADLPESIIRTLMGTAELEGES